ncbi:MAG: CRTAC1 family protein [Acidobacteria bacterium]|nr:CRTAC1 family protein [Acidobacteriota bacterium]
MKKSSFQNLLASVAAFLVWLIVPLFAGAQIPAISFIDVSAASGINVSHVSSADNRYIVESMSGGVALFDCDGDGFLDAATVNGSSVENYKKGGDLFVTLYRQIDGKISKTPKFENITTGAGLSRRGWGMTVTAVDYDNDGLIDLLVTGFGGNAVYRGIGQCKFQDATEKSGLKGSGFMTGAAWADYDRDGDLDLFVARYVSLNLNNLPVFGSSQTCSFKGIRVQCGPRGLPGETDLFYRNKGDGSFEELAVKIGVGDQKKYYGLGAVWGDYDNDGWLDLYVANDGTPNYLYKNNKNGTFTEVGAETGTSYSGAGVEQGSMGIAWGDYDNDGKPDIFVTNFDNEHNTLYKNLGSKGFLDVSMESQLGAVSLPYVGWGTSFEDFDNDGWLDLFIVNGHVYPQIELAKTDTQMGFRQNFLLHRNLGNGTFIEISKKAGLHNLPLLSRRGAAFGDINNDGFIDVIVTNLGSAPTVLLNNSENKNGRVILELVQTKSNQSAIGARAVLRTDKRTMMREVQAGASYLSQNDCRVHFGLRQNEKIENVEVRWSDGTSETVSNITPNRIFTVTQNKGITSVSEFQPR